MDFKKFSMFMLVSAMMVPQLCFGLVGSRVNLTTVISVAELLDGSNNQIIQATVGDVTSDPSTWTVTTLSNGISTTNNLAPRLFTNASGDVIVAWVYIDSNDVFQLAASILLSGTTTWVSANVSQSIGSAAYTDHVVSMNENGDTLLVWTAQDLISGNNVILGATAAINDSTDWSTPFVILPA